MKNAFAKYDNGNGYEEMLWYKYFDVQITQKGTAPSECARFKKNRITGATYVFQSNCVDNNCWNEHGYGWGVWRKV